MPSSNYMVHLFCDWFSYRSLNTLSALEITAVLSTWLFQQTFHVPYLGSYLFLHTHTHTQMQALLILICISNKKETTISCLHRSKPMCSNIHKFIELCDMYWHSDLNACTHTFMHFEINKTLIIIARLSAFVSTKRWDSWASFCILILWKESCFLISNQFCFYLRHIQNICAYITIHISTCIWY